jgi:hypothetical protein
MVLCRLRAAFRSEFRRVLRNRRFRAICQQCLIGVLPAQQRSHLSAVQYQNRFNTQQRVNASVPFCTARHSVLNHSQQRIAHFNRITCSSTPPTRIQPATPSASKSK